MVQAGVAGLASGGAYAVIAVCLVLLQRMVGVVNFALTAVGAFGVFTMVALHGDGVPFAPAAVAGVIVGAALSAAYGFVVVRWFFEASATYRATVTIAMLLGTTAAAYRIFGAHPREIPSAFSGSAFVVADVVVSWTTVAIIGFAIVLALAVNTLLQATHLGIQLRAVSSRPTSAELLGIPARALAVGVWAATGAASVIAVMLIGPTISSDYNALSLLIVPGLAAALLGLMRSFTMAIVGGLLLGVSQGVVNQTDNLSEYTDVVPFLLTVVVLLWTQRKEVWDVAR